MNKVNVYSRKDTSVLGKWWLTVDRLTLVLLMVLVILGILLSFAASPPVALRLNLGAFYFVKRHIVMVLPSLLVMIGISLLPIKSIQKISLLLYLIGVLLLLWTFFYGLEIKGARRWIVLLGNSMQASEFVKPAFTVLSAWLIAEKSKEETFPAITISLFALGILLFLLMLQPDLGMSLIISTTWLGQLFIAGMSVVWMVILAVIGVSGVCATYFMFPHVTKRIDQFFDPATGNTHQDLYQITKSLEAFVNGGLLGRGPGEGVVKKYVPDAHADFVFAVAGEEFGLILCLVIVFIFAVIVVRSLIRSIQNSDIFILLATSGLAMQFGLQAFINMASALHVIPTKGMTMPFISYGGSSMLALSISAGMILSLTRKRHGVLEGFSHKGWTN
jgi:cell division protein FtsW